jgi:hypothetical protein
MTAPTSEQLAAIAQVACPRCHVPAHAPCPTASACHRERLEFAELRRRELAKLKEWTR